MKKRDLFWGLSGLLVLGISVEAAAKKTARHPAQDPNEVTVASYLYDFSPDDLSECKTFTNRVTDEQQAVINSVMAAHEHRLNHLLWHSTRNDWSGLTKTEQKAIQALSPEWGKNAPVCPLPAQSITAKNISPSGEEFLLMHHQMMDHLRMSLRDKELPCIAGWETLPKKDDPVWPVPAGDKDDSSKSDDTGAMMDAWLAKFEDEPGYLKGKSLSYIGTLVENSLHNNMHMRWSPQPGTGDDYSPLDVKHFAARDLNNGQYDAATYHWLGNPYSAHVDAHFWKLHGWVDSTIGRWLKANGFEIIAENCSQYPKRKCYQWKSSWVGPSMHDTGTGGVMAKAPVTLSEPTVTKLFSAANFRNTKFDRFEQSRKNASSSSGALKGVKAPARDTSLDDPAAYVAKFGPCSPN